MTFFNQKTEVIDLELTPYGRSLLAEGKLMPKYYEFVDDDIIYDISHTGAPVESQENAHNRIINETPRLKHMTNKSGVETSFKIHETLVNQNDRIDNTRLTYDQKYIGSLGRFSYSAENSPFYQVQMLRGEITGSHTVTTSSVVSNMQIPRLELSFNVFATTASINTDSPNKYLYSSNVYSDGKFIILDFEEPTIHFKEFNSFYEKENFEIEVYAFENETLINQETIDKIVPLFFQKRRTNIKNGIYIEPSPIVTQGDTMDTNDFDEPEEGTSPKNLEYYFEILVDDEIPVEEICEVVNKLEVNNQLIDKELICPDQRTERFDIYSTRVSPGDLEDCD